VLLGRFVSWPNLPPSLSCSLTEFSTCIIAIVKTALLPALFDHEEKDKTWSMAQLCFWAPYVNP
jgi:hypothetical protein